MTQSDMITSSWFRRALTIGVRRPSVATKPCTYNSVSFMRHYPRSTKIYSVQKLANAGVRNFYAYENFSDYCTTLHRNPIQASASCHARAFPKTTAVVRGEGSGRKWLCKKQGTYNFLNWRFKVFSTNSKISRSTKPNTKSKTLTKTFTINRERRWEFFLGPKETCEQNAETEMQKTEKTEVKDEGIFPSIWELNLLSHKGCFFRE